MAASCSSLTSDAPRRRWRWPRRATARAARAAARAAAASASTSFNMGAAYHHHPHHQPAAAAVRRRPRRARRRTSAYSTAEKLLRKPTIWEAQQAAQLSKLVLGFKLDNGRLPSTPSKSIDAASDNHFWAACYSCFHGRFSLQQLRRKVHCLKLRYINISSGLAKSIKLAEKDVFDIWCLIMQPQVAAPPAYVPFPNVHDDDAAHNVPPSCPAEYCPPVCNLNEIACANDNAIAPETPSPQYFVHEDGDGWQAPTTGKQYGSDDPQWAKEKGGVATAAVASQNEDPGDGSIHGASDNGDAVAASTCSSESHIMHSKEEEHHHNSGASYGAHQNSKPFRGSGNDYGAAFNRGEYEPKSSLQHYATIAELATATKVLAQATLSANSTTCVLAHTTQTLAQILVSYTPPAGA